VDGQSIQFLEQVQIETSDEWRTRRSKKAELRIKKYTELAEIFGAKADSDARD
jgi:hypothetical protein